MKKWIDLREKKNNGAFISLKFLLKYEKEKKKIDEENERKIVIKHIFADPGVLKNKK